MDKLKPVLWYGVAAAAFYVLWKMFMPGDESAQEEGGSGGGGKGLKSRIPGIANAPSVPNPVSRFAGFEDALEGALWGGSQGPGESDTDREHYVRADMDSTSQDAQEAAETALHGGNPPPNPFREPESLKSSLNRQYGAKRGSYDDDLPVDDQSNYSSVLEDVRAADAEEGLDGEETEGYDEEGPVKGEQE